MRAEQTKPDNGNAKDAKEAQPKLCDRFEPVSLEYIAWLYGVPVTLIKTSRHVIIPK